MMVIIGLTGNIASGKSAVSEILRSLGAAVIDADKVAREVVEPGMPGWQQIISCFGRDVLRADDTLDREKLGRRVFADPEELGKLNAITHPLIFAMIQARLTQLASADNVKAALIDAPLLIETGLHRTVDELWVVAVEPDIQLKRVMERDHLTREEALARIAAQMPQMDKRQLADIVIENNGTLQQLRVSVENLWRQRLGEPA